ncbi:MAG TPA: hypothetical protein PKD10_19715 [Paracoccaceae bacterium]|nr:hypothetical protein [Paracoccaceae bacterium]
MPRRAALALALPALAAAAACTAARPADVGRAATAPEYLGIETALLDDDLVRFRVALRGGEGRAGVDAYARCAAAQYALIRGYGFARHVRTTVAERGGICRGDAVYTVSPALPRGIRTLDAEVVVRDCGAQGIPTV